MSKAAEILMKRVDLKGLVIEDILQGVVKSALEKIVKDTSNPYDDSMMAFIYPIIEEAAVKFLEDQMDKIK